MMTYKSVLLLGLVSLLCLSVFSQSLRPKDQEAILTVFQDQEAAWNEGDVDRFMNGYWNSDSLAFIGGSGITYGWQQTLDNYKRRYPDRQTMGQLTFTLLSLKKLGPKSAHVIGKWHLKREIGDIGGHFTLIWRKIQGEWLIVSDHTSSES